MKEPDCFTGRKLIKFILDNRLENSDIVFESQTDNPQWYYDVKRKHLVIQNSLLIIKCPEIKQKN